MTKHQVTCSLVTAENTKQSFVWHDHLGVFESEWHQHARGQLMFAEKGCIHVDIEGKKLLLPGWYCAWVPADTHHKVWSNNPVYIRTIYFGKEVTTDPIFNQPCVFAASPLLKEMIVYTAKWHKLPTPDEAERNFLQALQSILPGEMAQATPACLPTTAHDKLVPVLEFIQRNLHDKIALEDIAREHGYASRTLTRAFQQHLGMSFSGYLRIARAFKALELIEQGADNVSTLAYDVGYESVSTFSNSFLEICGMRPLEFMATRR